MRFWDSSALVPLLLQQPRSSTARALLEQDGEMVVWWGSAGECASAVARLQREGLLTPSDEQAARNLLELLRGSWFELQPGGAVREQALRCCACTHCAPRTPSSSPRRWSGRAAHPRGDS